MTAGNTAGGILMVDQGRPLYLTKRKFLSYDCLYSPDASDDIRNCRLTFQPQFVF